MQSTSRINQQRGEMPSRSRSFAWVHLQMFLMAVVFSCIPSSRAFNLQMTYKPPVKSSVGKLQDPRFSRDLSARQGDSPSRSSSSKSASAAGVSYYQPASDTPTATSDDSFERRMRDMVLGNQKQRKVTRTTTMPTRKLPPNVRMVETLQEYKKVVADETESVVAVRFYAPWCKVSKHCTLELEYCQKSYSALIAFCFISTNRHVKPSLQCFIT
jgi:hypothetical protein